jgi:hypothetical protein
MFVISTVISIILAVIAATVINRHVFHEPLSTFKVVEQAHGRNTGTME